MGFVGNYAPRGLSPQMYDMPVIQEKGLWGLLIDLIGEAQLEVIAPFSALLRHKGSNYI